MEDPAVTKFRDYLRIKTVQPDPDYDTVREFLKNYAEELGLNFRCITVHDAPKREVILMTWKGTKPELPTLLLNSHTDVVPVFCEFWKHDPFAADKEENGDIHARGTQDMKCVGIQYLEAIRKLKADGVSFPRTIHLSFVPDEEIGGVTGMQPFVHMQEFKNLNIGFVFDEGLANPTDAFTVFYGERSPWWVKVKATGKPGHGSRFIENNAGEKIRRIINSFLEFRDKEEKRLKSNPDLLLGDVTSVNLTKMSGGVQTNVVPVELTAWFDIRITPTVDLKEFDAQIVKWCRDAGEGVEVEFEQKYEGSNITALDDKNVWWKAFKSACDGLGVKLELEIFPAATDSRFIRALGYPAIGFSPINNTPILLHDHNEFLNEKVFLDGIDIYTTIIPALANVPAS